VEVKSICTFTIIEYIAYTQGWLYLAMYGVSNEWVEQEIITVKTYDYAPAIASSM
jgi:hypothetical protein